MKRFLLLCLGLFGCAIESTPELKSDPYMFPPEYRAANGTMVPVECMIAVEPASCATVDVPSDARSVFVTAEAPGYALHDGDLHVDQSRDEGPAAFYDPRPLGWVPVQLGVRWLFLCNDQARNPEPDAFNVFFAVTFSRRSES